MYVIAEIASAHDGDYNIAKKIINSAINSGADAIKLQVFKRNSLLIKTNPYYENFGEVELTDDNWLKLIAKISKKNIDLIIEPYDLESFKLCESTGFIQSYKIPASSLNDRDLMSEVKITKKPVYIGVGGAKKIEIKKIASLFDKELITLLTGFQNFPTKIEDSNLWQISKLKKDYKCNIGYADHTDAEDMAMRFIIPSMAVAKGATIIEKHITDDRSRKGRDYFSALEPNEFKQFVNLMHQLHEVVGNDNDWVLSKAEIEYRKFSKKVAVTSRSISSGEKFESSDVVFKRTNDEGLSLFDIETFFGKTFNKEKKVDEPINKDDFCE